MCGREVYFSPCVRCPPGGFLESYFSVVWRTPGMTGPCHIHHNPSPHPSQADDRSAYRCMLLQPSPLESVAPALGIHAFTSPRLTSKDFFARDFLAGVTYIREQCCFCVGRSPRIWSNLRFAPMRMDPRLRLVIVI